MPLDGILVYAMKRTHFKARQIIGHHGFIQADFPDLRQELLLDILARMPKFNGSRAGAKTFISRLIDHRIADIIEHRCAGCRDHRREESSLDDWVRDEQGKWQTQAALTDVDRGKAHRELSPRSRQERAELILDVHEVVDSLPPDLRDLVEHLLRSETIVGIARVTGLSTSTLYRRLEQIRVRFREAGLDGYL